MLAPTTTKRQSASFIAGLLGAGVVYWILVFGISSLDFLHDPQAKITVPAILVAAIGAFFPQLGQRIIQLFEWINGVLSPRAAKTAVAIALLSAVYLLLFDHASRELLFLKFNDEHAYMIQARMLARGRLWMPAYPADVVPFFDALSLIGDRVYAAMYFPGTALAMVPFVWLNLPFWLMPLLCAAVSLGLLYVLIAELFDPLRGILAVLMVLSLAIFRNVAGNLLSEMPFLAAELVLLLAWLRFRKQPRMGWALLLGVAGGFAAITRPLDAVCLAIPVGCAILWQLRAQRGNLLRPIVVIFIGAIPFLALLAVQSKGVTGQWNDLAEAYYNRENFPASPMGFHPDVSDQISANMVPIKQQWLHDWLLPKYKQHTPMNELRGWYRDRLGVTLAQSLPDSILAILLPVSLLCLGDVRKRVLAMYLGLFLLGYAMYLFYLDHYVIAILPAMVCLIMGACEVIRQTWPAHRRVYVFALLSIVALSVARLWPLAPIPPVSPTYAIDQRLANSLLANLPRTPAVVLFRFDPRVEAAHDDPVYNDTVAWPDDATVVRARDLGAEKDRDLFGYYAQHQPQRVFYIYDPDARARAENPLSSPLGTAAQLMETAPSTGTPPPPG